MTSSLDGVLHGTSGFQIGHGLIQIAFALVTLGHGPAPEFPVFLAASPIGKHNGQRYLAFAEIVPNILAEFQGRPAIIQGIVDELESYTEIVAIGSECRPRVIVRPGKNWADFGRRGKKGCGFRTDDVQIGVFGGVGVLCRVGR